MLAGADLKGCCAGAALCVDAVLMVTAQLTEPHSHAHRKPQSPAHSAGATGSRANVQCELGGANHSRAVPADFASAR